VFLVLGGWASTAVGISFISMLADAADEHELLFGSRREGLYFAGLTFSAKAAIGIGSLVAGIALDLIRFPRDTAVLQAGRIDADVVRNLGLIAGPIAGLIALTSAFVLIGYRLDARRYAEIQSALAARRGA
jgi:GPH family glycoside/pentoside/hexuronide:cation symporter